MGLFNLFKPARTVLVIDTVSLNESLGLKGKVPPRNQLQMLRKLSRFAQREKIEVIAVLSGTPLNKAPAGKKFDDVLVLYSKSADDHSKFLARTASGKGSGAILISGNAAAEKLAGAGVRKMRISTFRKAYDTGGGGDTQEKGGNNSGNSSRNRPQRRRQQKQVKTQERKERPKKESSDVDAINELIDLVD
jgi:hypothetical protein